MANSMDYSLPVGRDEISCLITFAFEKGYKGDEVDPPYPASAEIIKVEVYTPKGRELAPDWLFEIVKKDDTIHADLVYEAENGGANDNADHLRDERRNAA